MCFLAINFPIFPSPLFSFFLFFSVRLSSLSSFLPPSSFLFVYRPSSFSISFLLYLLSDHCFHLCVLLSSLFSPSVSPFVSLFSLSRPVLPPSCFSSCDMSIFCFGRMLFNVTKLILRVYKQPRRRPDKIRVTNSALDCPLTAEDERTELHAMC